ncbi:MAG: hypothetical protein H6657_22115 [Ardenticatenaceae bacterium]|nr:hypothetical protein [Ardenticatenaceae bacterium]
MNKFRSLSWLLTGLLVISACTQTDSATEPTVAATAVVTAAAVSPQPTATSTPHPTEAVPTAEPTTTPTAVPTSSVRLITDEPVFTGGDLQFVGWSPDGRYLAYFEYTEEQVAESPAEGLRGAYPGTFVFYDTETGEKCTDYPYSGLFSYEGSDSGAPWRWLPNGQMLLALPDGRLVQTSAPCAAETDLTQIFPKPISSIRAASPDGQKLILQSSSQYWLYDWAAQTALPIAEVRPDGFNNLIWSLDSQHISITLAGNYTGDGSPIGGTRVVDVATGTIIARYDWEPANALDGTFGGPVWINNEAFVVTLSLDQGPFLMNLNGAVQPLLPLLFDETFDPENYWPPLDVYADVENGRYAILRSNEGRDDVAKLYTFTPEGEALELFEAPNTYHLFPDGTVGYGDSSYWSRPIFDTEARFEKRPYGPNPWQITPNQLYATANSGTITVFNTAQRGLVERIQVAGYESGYILYPLLSPNDQWLAIFVNEPRYSLGKALFVIPIEQD